MNWKFFVGASILAGGLAVKFGAPLLAVAAGVAIVGLFNWTRERTAARAKRH